MNTIWNDCSTCERGDQPDKLSDQHYHALALHHQGPLWAPSKVLFAITIIINITGVIYHILFIFPYIHTPIIAASEMLIYSTGREFLFSTTP